MIRKRLLYGRKTRRLAGKAALALFAALFLAVLIPAGLPVSASQVGEIRSGALAQVSPEKSWEFERFDVDIKVNTDGSLTVRETQVVNFTGSFSFLNRDLSAGKADFSEGRNYGQVRFKDIKVSDLEGRSYQDWKVEGIDGGKRVRISFSAFSEQKGWVIEYTMTGAIVYADDYDRLYFNTVSKDRGVPIKSSRTTVTLPEGTDMDEVKATEYPDEYNPPGELTSGRDGDTLWWEAKDIPPNTTLTIDVSFPKGLVQVPLVFRPWFGGVMIALAAILAVAVTAGMIRLWWKKGRDVGAPELDVVQYEPPAGLHPAEAGVLINESPSTGDITATIVDLAIRGKLVITEEEAGKLIKRKEFGFERKDHSVEDLEDYERKIMAGLFESGDSVTEDDLKNEFYTHVSGIDKSLKGQVLDKGFFDGDPAKVKGRYGLIGVVLLLLIVPVFLARSWFDLGYMIAFVPALAVSGVVVFVVGRYMPRRTEKGSQAYSYVMGFKEYMSTAEREEMKLMTPETFQVNLPYAMVLGVASAWAAKFADIFTSPPDWYRGYYPGTFSTVYLADSLSRMQTSVGGTLTSSPSSSGGGGGGFGGGSSGGGFGGGGSSAG